MLAHFFRLRLSLRPFASPSSRTSLRGFESTPRPDDAANVHSDYDRHPLRIQGFDHLIERAGDDRRFNVH